MNKVLLKGRITADPEIRYKEDMCIANGSIAVNRRKRDDGADFIRYSVFGRVAEAFEKYLRKGSEICVCGHIQTGEYTNKDGQKVYTTQIIIDEFDFCGSKGQQEEKEELPEPCTDDGFMDIPDGFQEELPFK